MGTTDTDHLTVRRAADIHHEQGGWFDARWHFSFGGYHDPEWSGVGPLRVFNDDRIVAGAEWPMHPHRDIESLTWVVSGRFRHADSLGNGRSSASAASGASDRSWELEAVAAQVMRFSHDGAQHSERNGSDESELRFLQFWILPSTEGLASDVQQRQWAPGDRDDRWQRIMSGDPDDLRPDDGVAGPLELAQDATVDVARATAGTTLSHTFAARRGGYLYVIDGEVEVGGRTLQSGDAVALREDGADAPRELVVTATAHRDADGGANAAADGGANATADGGASTAELILIDVPLDWEPVGLWRGRV